MADVGHWQLPHDATAPRLARQHLRALDLAWSHKTLDLVLLLATELVTNAVRHGAGPVQLRVDRTPSGVRVGVHDAHPAPPTTTTSFPAAGAEGGRGVPLLASLADEWGSDPDPRVPGKSTWFTIRTPR